MKFEIPHYDRAMVDFIQQIMDGFYLLDPLLGEIPQVNIIHTGPMRTILGDEAVDQTTIDVEIGTTLQNDVLREMEIERLTEFFYEFAQQQLAPLKEGFIQEVVKISEKTGMRFDGKKQPLNLDVLNDMLEKMHVDFDDQGNPRLPTLLVPPEMVETVKNLVPTDAQLVRRQQILDSKRKEHDDKKRSRRLS